MEVLRILWTINFFFFALILIFIWSKVIVISNKIKVVTTLVAKSEKIEYGEPENEIDEEENTDEGE